MMRRVLITGVTGFAGSHLADYLLTRSDCEVFGIHRWRSRTENIEHLRDRITLLECDLRDAFSTRDTLERVRPDWIFHLAAQSFVPTSWTAPTESLTTNVVGQVNVFEAMRKLGMHCRIQLACSSEEYGLVQPDEVPIKETNPLRPLSPYAVSKVGQDLLGYQYWMSWKVDCVRTRGLQPRGPATWPRVRGVGLRTPDRGHREGHPAADRQRRQSRLASRLHRRARHGEGVLARAREGPAGRGLQHLQRTGLEHP
jgi:GDP-4-dehydro-6-deoxy-D-mannose reductase